MSFIAAAITTSTTKVGGVLLGQFATTTYSAGWGVLPGWAHKPTIQMHMSTPRPELTLSPQVPPSPGALVNCQKPPLRKLASQRKIVTYS